MKFCRNILSQFVNITAKTAPKLVLVSIYYCRAKLVATVKSFVGDIIISLISTIGRFLTYF